MTRSLDRQPEVTAPDHAVGRTPALCLPGTADGRALASGRAPETITTVGPHRGATGPHGSRAAKVDVPADAVRVDAAAEGNAAGTALACASAQVGLLADVGAEVWAGRDPRELIAALSTLEALSRKVQAVASVVSATLVAAQVKNGRTEASAAREVAGKLHVPDGIVRDRVAAGRRSATPAMQSLRSGRITAAQERCVAKWLSELDGTDVPADARERLGRFLVELAETGAPTVVIGREAEAALCRLLPGRQDQREAAQARKREATTHQVQADGTSLLSVVCTPELRAVVDAIVARYARRGMCLPPVVDPETGVPADPRAQRDLDELAAADQRSHAQRVHDALRDVLETGLAAKNRAGGNSGPVGVASIIVRLAPEQAQAVFEGEHGGQVVTDAGTHMSARQATALADPRGWFLSALHQGRELLTRIPIDRILELRPHPPGGPTSPPGCERGSGEGPEKAGDGPEENGGGDDRGGTRNPEPRGPRNGPPPGGAPAGGEKQSGAQPRVGSTTSVADAATALPSAVVESPGPTSGSASDSALIEGPGSAPGSAPASTLAESAGSHGGVAALVAWKQEVTSTGRGACTGARDPRGPRLASAVQRLVLFATHGGCTHPGCHTPAARCQAHHIVEYRHGGRTILVNLCLVCPIHHGWIGTTPTAWRADPDPARPGRPRWTPPADDPLGPDTAPSKAGVPETFESAA